MIKSMYVNLPPTHRFKRLLVCGQRTYSDKSKIKWAIQKVNPETLICGGAEGADRLAEEIGRELGLEVLVFPADWRKYGRRAGPIRNQQMLDDGEPQAVLAFYNNKLESRGTVDMVRRARSADIPVKEFVDDQES